MNPTINLIVEWTAALPLDPRGKRERVTDIALSGDIAMDIEVEYCGRHVIDWRIGRIGWWSDHLHRCFAPAPEQPWFDALRAELRDDPWLDGEVRERAAEELAAGDDDFADALREERAFMGRAA